MTTSDAAGEYDAIADYYDLLFGDRTVDLPFWVTLAGRFGSPILEFASGTGRITLPLARAGQRVVGIDVSEKMLEKADEHLLREDSVVQERVTFIRANMTSFEFPMRFTAIFSPWGFPVVTDEEQDQCLQQARKHLVPKGYVVIDIVNTEEPTQDWSYHDLREMKTFPRQGFTLVRQSYQTGNAKTKMVQTIFFLDRVADDGTMRRFITQRTERLYTPDFVCQLLEQHGFVVEEMYGSYDFQPYEAVSSERAIIIARAA